MPSLEDDLKRYIQEELQQLERSISTLVSSSVQVADNPPDSPRKGMLRFNVSPWDPLGDASEGLVVYNGTAWVDV
jgi:hypothetical protein